MENISVRTATVSDILFLVDAIVAAEKSGTNNLGLANYFKLSEGEFKTYLAQILEEEVDGCEFSISSFIVAEIDGKVVSTFGGWLEGDNEDNLPSAILKSNLVGYCFPRENVLKSSQEASVVKALQIEREDGSYQLEYSYTIPEYRGKGLVGMIIDEHLRRAVEKGAKKVQVHVFDNNPSAIKSYEKKGFQIVAKFTSDNPKTKEYFPSDTELLMEKDIN